MSPMVAISAAQMVDAEFTSGGATVNVTVTGAGNVQDTANAGAINCTNTASGPQTGNCTSGYALGTVVTPAADGTLASVSVPFNGATVPAIQYFRDVWRRERRRPFVHFHHPTRGRYHRSLRRGYTGNRRHASIHVCSR